MVRQTITDTFETIGDAFQKSSKQIAYVPFQISEEILRQLGIKPLSEPEKGKKPDNTQQPNPEVAKRKAFANKRISELEAEIQAIVQKKAQEIPKAISGKPGFSEEKMVKQFETEKKEKDKLPPVVIAAKGKASAEKRQFGGG